MSYWMETSTRIYDNGSNFRWEIVSLDDGMITLRYQEPEGKQWKTLQEIEVSMDVAKIMFKDEVLPKVKDFD